MTSAELIAELRGHILSVPLTLLHDAADALEADEKRIAELEAQKPKEGEWIDGDARKVTARCSVCGHLRLGNGAKWANMYVPFCEICGARMKGESNGNAV